MITRAQLETLYNALKARDIDKAIAAVQGLEAEMLQKEMNDGKKIKYRIHVHGGTEEVYGTPYGDVFAIDKRKNGYTLTHTPSGLSAFSGSFADCRRVAMVITHITTPEIRATEKGLVGALSGNTEFMQWLRSGAKGPFPRPMVVAGQGAASE